jgi:hypothetical protein
VAKNQIREENVDAMAARNFQDGVQIAGLARNEAVALPTDE